jgi:hypothetical protein
VKAGRRVLVAGLATLLLATPTVGGTRQVPEVVTLDGAGTVRPRMTMTEVERRLGVRLRSERFGPCTMAFFGSGIPPRYAIFWRGRLGSLWFEGRIRTDRGIRLGSTFAELRRAYPRALVRRDHYVRAARNVFVRRTQPPHWRLRFDVSPQGRVTRIAHGNWTIFLVEGCA